MKILVTVKRVIDYNVQVRVKSDNSGVEKENVKMSMNPPDENAVEEALRIKEAGKADEAILLSNLKKRQGRAELQRGIYTMKNNKYFVKTVGEQGSGILSSMNNANCLIYLPVEKGKSNKNDVVKIIKFKNYI